MSDLERELEFELHRALDPISRMAIPPRRSPRHAPSARAVLGGAGAALSLKLLTGVAVAAAAVTVAGAATTGSINPVDWGTQVSQRVADCKAKLTDGHHGIGDCVSALATQHGQAVASAARHHGQGQGEGTGQPGNNGQGNGAGNGKDKGKDHPTPGPKNGAGRPTPEPEPVDQVHPRDPVSITPGP